MAVNQDYTSLDYNSARNELFEFIRQYYPDTLKDFNDSSVGSMLVDLAAASVDLLSHHTDRMFQETQISQAQLRKSLVEMARTLGVQLPNKRASVTLVDFTITVPGRGDEPDPDYLPILRTGAQVEGGGKIFELTNDIDFSSDFSQFGAPNRIVIPNIDDAERVESYNITKREVVFNGITRIQKRTIETIPNNEFFELILPQNDVISVESIIVKQGRNLPTPNLQEFYDEDIRYYEVDFLAQQEIFTEDFGQQDGISQVSGGTVLGKVKQVDQKFIKEFTEKGYCKIIFGNGSLEQQNMNNQLENACISNNTNNTNSNVGGNMGGAALQGLAGYLNNTALGVKPSNNSTMFIRYRTGGGSDSNVGEGTIENIGGGINFNFGGTNQQIINSVQNSLTVNNPIPALGGADRLSNEQIRRLISYNFSAQKRTITLRDYVGMVQAMPGKYGSPFKLNAYTSSSDNNSPVKDINLVILSVDENFNLTNTSTSYLRNNISNYLTLFKPINDNVIIRNGKIINISYEFDVLVGGEAKNKEVVNDIVNEVTNFHNINNRDLGEDIYIGRLLNSINNVTNVLNITDYKIFNKVGSPTYSDNETSMELLDTDTRRINISDFILYATKNEMFEIKYPETDIKVKIHRVNNNSDV